jgi:hypothetical protein
MELFLRTPQMDVWERTGCSFYPVGALPGQCKRSDKKLIVKNLFLSDIPEEFIAMQLDLDIPTVVSILKEMNAYNKTTTESLAA